MNILDVIFWVLIGSLIGNAIVLIKKIWEDKYRKTLKEFKEKWVKNYSEREKEAIKKIKEKAIKEIKEL